jgi:hypothetical protein
MVAKAREMTSDPKISIRQGTAEDLSFLADKSVSCAVAGQAAHWFDYTRAWPELARVVAPGGTMAFWGYKDHIVVGHPQTIDIFDRFTYGKEDPVPGMESLDRYWERPGRDILRGSFKEIVPPEHDWDEVRKLAWDPDRKTGDIEGTAEEVVWMRKTLKLGELEGYVRTYSSFGRWKDQHPAIKSRADGGQGDIIDKLFDELLLAVPEWKAKGDKWRDIEVDVVWGTVLLMATRKHS